MLRQRKGELRTCNGDDCERNNRELCEIDSTYLEICSVKLLEQVRWRWVEGTEPRWRCGVVSMAEDASDKRKGNQLQERHLESIEEG